MFAFIGGCWFNCFTCGWDWICWCFTFGFGLFVNLVGFLCFAFVFEFWWFVLVGSISLVNSVVLVL